MTLFYYTSHPGAVNPENERVKFIMKNNIGLMVSAEHWNRPFTRYAVDNGAWTDFVRKQDFDVNRFMKALSKIDKLDIFPDFIVLPDIVQGGLKSLELSKRWMYLKQDYPCMLALQDGMIEDNISSDMIDGLKGIFIGGSNEWKYSTLPSWVKFARDNNLIIHVGKVGTRDNFIKCSACGVDSADGSSLVRNGKIHKIVEYRNEADLYYNKGLDYILENVCLK